MTNYQAYLEADKAWSAELWKEFGGAAQDARYTPKGTSTPELKRLSDIRTEKQKVWFDECDTHRIYR